MVDGQSIAVRELVGPALRSLTNVNTSDELMLANAREAG
jgi:hypothetical protein